MRDIIKKTLAVLFITFITVVLSGCSNEKGPADLKSYDGGLYTISINPEWRIITKSDFYAEIPEEAEVAFTAPEAYDGFFINVNVVRENLKEAIAPIEYGQANVNLAAQNLTDYEKIQQAQVDLNGHPGMVHIFKARLNPTEKLIRFVQLYTTQGKTGYIISGGMLPDTPDSIREQVGAIVTSFRFK